MRRWLAPLLLGVFVLAVIGWARLPAPAAPEQPTVLTICTDMTPGMVQTLADTYRRRYGVPIEVVAGSEEQILERLAEGLPTDLLLGSESLLREAAARGMLQAYTSEQTDIVPAEFKNEEGYWTGAWYVPVVFAVTDEYWQRSGGSLRTWQDLVRQPELRVAMTDFLAADVPAELLCSLVEYKGKEEAFRYLQELQANVVQYSKFLSTPVRLLALQKADVAIADAATVRLFLADGFPLKMVYPQDGTAYSLYGFGVPQGGDLAAAGAFIDWELHGEGFQAMHEKKYYVYYTGYPPEQVADALGNELVLWPLRKEYRYDGRRELVAQWVKEVRFAGKEATATKETTGKDKE
ncbi:MAG: extracellular solute-binding protein [Veillonellaceae bacterium]|nr:extracellular solute-binding protein [Veillonellaceae bacterium]